jgi:hypothetical protein
MSSINIIYNKHTNYSLNLIFNFNFFQIILHNINILKIKYKAQTPKLKLKYNATYFGGVYFWDMS